MKFLTILAATLPALAAASALPGLAHGEGDKSNGIGQWNDEEGQQQGHSHGAGQGPPDGDEGAHAHGEHEQRNLTTRGVKDIEYMIEECPDKWNTKDCKQQTIISKGATKGLCVTSLRPWDDDGTIHIINDNVMCTYFEKYGCNGDHRGPWSNKDPEYNLDTYQGDFYRWHPASYKCQVMTFDSVRAPGTRYREEK